MIRPARQVTVIVAAAMCTLCACQSAVTRSAPKTVSGEVQTYSTGMTRQQLDAEVRRYALRAGAQAAGFYEGVRATNLTPDERARVVQQQSRAMNSFMTIAIGDNPLTNLLDMLALTSLARIEAENAAVDRYGDLRGTQLVEIMRVLEVDIWNIAGSVLTGEQQEKLKSLFADWYTNNPGQSAIWLVRFDAFSGVEVDELEELQRDGGLVSQFARATDTAQDLNELAERLLFYLEYAPFVFSLQAQSTVYEVMRQPEFQESITNANNLARVLEGLPDARLEFVDQLLEGIAVERAALIDDIVDEQTSISQLLTDLRPVLESAVLLTTNVNEAMQSAERTAVAVNLDMGGESADIDVGDYQQLVIESATTVVELRQLVEALDKLAQSQLINDGIPPAFQSVRNEIDYFLHRFFVLLALSIVLFFGVLFLYRYGRYRYHR